MNPADIATDSETRWTREVLNEACAEVGLDSTDARLIKFTNNAVYALTTAPVVVRIPGSEAVASRVPKIIAVARWLAANDMPSVRLIEELPQPLRLGEHDITFWHRVGPVVDSPRPDGRALGRILRRYHALPPPEFDLPKWEPLHGIRRRIDQQHVLNPTELAFLQRKSDDIEEQLGQIDYALPPGPIHGDGFVGNLIPGPDGAIICDFDSAAHGPREWDLTPAAVGKVRFDYPTDYHSQLAEEYGVDILQWPYFPALRQLRELQLVTSVLPVLNTNPGLYDQWHKRFVSFRDGDTAATWTTYR